MYALLNVIDLAITLYIWLIIASAIMSWLVAFGVINTSNQFVRTVGEFLYRITEPALRPLRRVIPPIGGIDITPIILYFILIFVQGFIRADLPRMVGGYY
jgi:YggT family protein